MPESRLPKQLLLAGPLTGWKRQTGGVKKSWRRRVAEDTQTQLRPPSHQLPVDQYSNKMIASFIFFTREAIFDIQYYFAKFPMICAEANR